MARPKVLEPKILAALAAGPVCCAQIAATVRSGIDTIYDALRPLVKARKVRMVGRRHDYKFAEQAINHYALPGRSAQPDEDEKEDDDFRVYRAPNNVKIKKHKRSAGAGEIAPPTYPQQLARERLAQLEREGRPLKFDANGFYLKRRG